MPDTVFGIEDVPHDWLFPRMKAVVHHGGAGTTAAGLRAGVPSIITPYTADQPHWAAKIVELGVGPKTLPLKKLTAQALASFIQEAITNKEMQDKAAALGAKIREEDGIVQAIQVIESHINNALHQGRT